MTRANYDPIARARAILNAAVFSRGANGYVLSSDQRNELLAILDGEDATADESETTPSKRAKKKS